MCGASFLSQAFDRRAISCSVISLFQLLQFLSANFFVGNCENTIPTGGSGNVDRTHYQQEKLGNSDWMNSKRITITEKAAFTWIENHPRRALILYFEKTANFFNVYNEFAPENKAEVSFWKQGVMAVSYVILLALLAWRLLEMKRYPLTTCEKLFLLIYVLSAFTCALFFTRIRLRLPYDYLIIAMIAAYFGQRLAEWLVPVQAPELQSSLRVTP